MNRKDYLRGRPFLIIKTFHRPAANVSTVLKNWGEQPDAWVSHETPMVADHINRSMMESATVIIDLVNSKLIKNRYSDTPDDKVMEYYLNKFSAQTKEGISLWMDKQKLALQRTMLTDPPALNLVEESNAPPLDVPSL